MAIPESVRLAFSIMSMLGSGISLIILSMFIFIIAKQLYWKDNTNQAVLYIFIFESIYCVGILLPTTQNDNNTILCKLQSSTIVFSTISVNIWMMMIGYLSWKSFVDRSFYDSTKKRLKLIFLISICLLAFIISVLYVYLIKLS